MTLTVEAIYENGVLKPLAPLNLAEHQHVMVQVMTAVEPTVKPDPTVVTFKGIWSSVYEDEIDEALQEIRAETNRKLGHLADEIARELGES